jgi:hypothetical protein
MSLYSGVEHNQNLMFNLTNLIEASDSFPKGIVWSVSGLLTTVGPQWVFDGNIVSSQPGFSKLNMSPATDGK